MADESYWTWKASTPTPSYDAAVLAGAITPDTMSESGWHSLTPGMRREIVRNAERRNANRAQAENK